MHVYVWLVKRATFWSFCGGPEEWLGAFWVYICLERELDHNSDLLFIYLLVYVLVFSW